MTHALSAPRAADWVSAQAWLVRIGLEEHLHEDALFLMAVSANPPALDDARYRHLQCCPACRRAVQDMRGWAPAMAMPLQGTAPRRTSGAPEPARAVIGRPSLLRMRTFIQAGLLRWHRLSSLGWAAAAGVALVFLARLSGDDDPGGQRAAMRSTPSASASPAPAPGLLDPSELARLRALGPPGEDYARVLASQGPQALRDRLRRDAPHSQVARQWLDALKP